MYVQYTEYIILNISERRRGARPLSRLSVSIHMCSVSLDWEFHNNRLPCVVFFLRMHTQQTRRVIEAQSSTIRYYTLTATDARYTVAHILVCQLFEWGCCLWLWLMCGRTRSPKRAFVHLTNNIIVDIVARWAKPHANNPKNSVLI